MTSSEPRNDRSAKRRRALPSRRWFRRARIEQLESRNLMSAIPLGATSQDTGEYLLGRIAVVPVLFESDGTIDANTEDWSPAKIDLVLQKVHDGVQWWADTLAALHTVHKLEFVIDDTFARNPVATPYEPINHDSRFTPNYIGPFLQAQGISAGQSLEDGVQQFNNAEREKLGTDWAFTIFLINSNNDADGQFASGGDFSTAFAFAGGLYVVTPSTRPIGTITHETGHIFWAKDEYSGGAPYSDRRGYYDTQNLNAANNPAAGFVQEPSIMAAGSLLQQAFNTHTLPASTRAMIGWQDSDGDGIFDVLDVPLAFQGSGKYDFSRGVFKFDGTASAVALRNRNSSGPQNDITLNKVDRIQYRVDGGAWQTAETIGTQVADVHFSLTIPAFNSIEFRAIDDTVGVTSPILRTTGAKPIVSGASIGGFTFLDSSGEGEDDPAEPLLSSVTATLTKADGTALFSGQVEPDDFAKQMLPATVAGASISADGFTLDGSVWSRTATASTGTFTFQYYNSQTQRWQGGWDINDQFVAKFAQPVGGVELDAIGVTPEGSYGRLEAYDSTGQLIARFTTDKLAVGQTATMHVEVADGRIASIRAFGHQASAVGLDALKFGTNSTVVTGADGVFKFAGLADGAYKLSLAPERLIYQYSGSAAAITVAGGIATPIVAAFDRVASPWKNSVDQYDVDGNGSVSVVDALRVINELGRHGTHILTNPSQITGFYDVSDDGDVSVIDALRVLNEMGRRKRAAASGESVIAKTDAAFALWDPQLEKTSSR